MLIGTVVSLFHLALYFFLLSFPVDDAADIWISFYLLVPHLIFQPRSSHSDRNAECRSASPQAIHNNQMRMRLHSRWLWCERPSHELPRGARAQAGAVSRPGPI
ncbi:hypothetical protein B0J18DRAFT_428536 [Chaetomium sp. MPI-SDFR-AT-0129]|nr:hypothetical protein B0J18DRAFT_428536 [Chaetomium sp. MPI-SDFR-AT-0129]